MELINVDNVYKTVLAIVNKENRGYIAPYEFNKIGTQVQLSLIDKTFYDYNRAINDLKQYGVNEGYADIIRIAREKIDFISTSADLTFVAGNSKLPSDLYKLDSIYTMSGLDSVKFEEIPKNEIHGILSSPLTQPSALFPLYYLKSGEVNLLPNTAPLNASTANIDYVKKPQNPRWGYIESVNYGDYLYDSNPYKENYLVIKDNAFETIDVNITTGVDGEYTVSANVYDASSNIVGVASVGVLVVSNNIEVVDVLSYTPTAPYVLKAGDVLKITGASVSGTGTAEIIISNENMYNNSTAGSIDFSLHPMEEINIVIGILAYAGIVIRDGDITNMANQIAQTKEMNKAQV